MDMDYDVGGFDPATDDQIDATTHGDSGEPQSASGNSSNTLLFNINQ